MTDDSFADPAEPALKFVSSLWCWPWCTAFLCGGGPLASRACSNFVVGLLELLFLRCESAFESLFECLLGFFEPLTFWSGVLPGSKLILFSISSSSAMSCLLALKSMLFYCFLWWLSWFWFLLYWKSAPPFWHFYYWAKTDKWFLCYSIESLSGSAMDAGAILLSSEECWC